jgi:hypothetical protein
MYAVLIYEVHSLHELTAYREVYLYLYKLYALFIK